MEAKPAKPEVKIHCFFCGGALHRQSDGHWVCHGCGAFFEAQLDPQGCLLALSVVGCGTPDCCQHQRP